MVADSVGVAGVALVGVVASLALSVAYRAVELLASPLVACVLARLPFVVVVATTLLRVVVWGGVLRGVVL